MKLTSLEKSQPCTHEILEWVKNWQKTFGWEKDIILLYYIDFGRKKYWNTE